MARDWTLVKVSIFTVVMLLVAAILVVVFGEFRFAADSSYHATFTDASRLKAGQDVRISGRYQFSSAMLMFWPGAGGPMDGPGVIGLSADSRESVQY